MGEDSGRVIEKGTWKGYLIEGLNEGGIIKYYSIKIY